MAPADLWYKDAIIYELHVRAFYDSNGDGIGDFAGLTEKLDYIQDLGVDALWLLPFYKSPLKDDGYDISDYDEIHPDYGTIADFRRFMKAAHKRGIRVITDLVVNHTSDQHPWFQESRKSVKSPKRDFYVWSDTDKKFADARIIFTDTEKSNWTQDPLTKHYYWHRFFSSQPDLNYDNPKVMDALWKTMRRWLAMGMDGFRLDAVPTLSSAKAPPAKTCPKPTRSSRNSAAASRRNSRAKFFSPRRINGPRTCGHTSASRTSATWLFIFL